LTALEVKHFNKRATIITLSVLGGVLVTAFALDAVDDDAAPFDDDVDVEQRVLVGERIGAENDDVRDLTDLERAQVLALADGDRGVLRHDGDQILVREHERERSEFMTE